MTNETFILHDFPVSLRLDMLLFTKTNTFKLASTLVSSQLAELWGKKLGSHSQQNFFKCSPAGLQPIIIRDTTI